MVGVYDKTLWIYSLCYESSKDSKELSFVLSNLKMIAKVFESWKILQKGN